MATPAAVRAMYHGPTDSFGFPIGTLDDQYEFCIVVDLEVRGCALPIRKDDEPHSGPSYH